MKSLTLLALVLAVIALATVVSADSDSHSHESHESHSSHDDHDDHDDDHDDHDHDEHGHDDHGHDDHSGHGHAADNMKGMSLAVITVLGWIVDVAVIMFPGLTKKKFLISIMTSLGGGIFAVSGVSHMLAEAVDIMNANYHDHDNERYRPAYMACILGYFFMLVLQRGVFKSQGHGSGDIAKEEDKMFQNSSSSSSENGDSNNNKDDHAAVVPMGEETAADDKQDQPKKDDATKSALFGVIILFVALMIHGIVEGIALGIQDSKEGVLLVFIAIVGHHWAMDMYFSFKTGLIPAEGGTPENPGSYFGTVGRVVLSFICTTNAAIGIAIGWGLSASIPSIAVAWLMGFSAGTFFFFAFSEIIVAEMPVGQRSIPQIIAFFIGIAGMYGAITGLYSEEAHNH